MCKTLGYIIISAYELSSVHGCLLFTMKSAITYFFYFTHTVHMEMEQNLKILNVFCSSTCTYYYTVQYILQYM